MVHIFVGGVFSPGWPVWFLMYASMILWLCRWTAAFCECLAWILPTLSNVRLTSCQNQQACLLCRPSSVWLLNPSWKPPTLLSKPTEAVWDYMCGYYPYHPLLHHTRWVVQGSSRTRSGRRCYHTQTRHSSCCTSLKSGCCCDVVSLGTERKDQSRKRGEFGKWQVYWTQSERCMPHSFIRLWLA